MNDPPQRSRKRMTGKERREQLLNIGRMLFADKGFDGTSIEEIAAVAKVSKPVVYEHFGGKEGLYAVVVDREMDRLLSMMTTSLTAAHPRVRLERAALALLQYIEESSEGFRILVRDSQGTTGAGGFASLLNDIASQVEHILTEEFKNRKIDPKYSSMYAQMLVGMVALTGQWWLDVRKPKREEVAAHLVNLAWNGLTGLEAKPSLVVSLQPPTALLTPPAERLSPKELREQEKARAREQKEQEKAQREREKARRELEKAHAREQREQEKVRAKELREQEKALARELKERERAAAKEAKLAKGDAAKSPEPEAKR
ncbi:TetR family transcriptional regulator [Rhizohabitans arisaemae]|uniref:TetR family transcriptional regulator n=1 Tax=Rhizohabitans arisaemae TaxID=2720610 RepID=UPI0024B071D6|nr:TetR family transcriptional regulator [Rhizohabitans arisaemae]